MFKVICVIAIISFSAIIKVNSLQCYECANCAQVTDAQIVTCGESTTVAPTTPSGQSTTVAPGQTTTPGQVTTTPDQTTTLAPVQTTTPAQVGTTTAAPVQTTTGTPVQITDPNTEGSEASRIKRAVLVQEKANEYVCLIVNHKVDNATVISRGCALDVGDGKVCEAITSSLLNATCTSCKEDKCNNAASIQVSLILMFVAALFRVF